ncbi:MAG: D-tyrosyl-tRNA(Tyr) deacylase [Streptococcaceae bacterium]|jgi:D-tyrosyl-tRNA(Tyr) deacylase|nr:D-tyrosyl-tRNA(Tyr) deacylase [Streptococcaceae bacterium]
MKVVIQRVSKAQVDIEGKTVGQIDKGFVVLLGIHESDTSKEVDYLVRKVSQMRIFEDEAGKMNLSLDQVGGQILLISQFTLYSDTKKGNRPGFEKAARPDVAIPLYEEFGLKLEEKGVPVKHGVFGADMQISLINDGPVTITIDTLE